MSIDGAPATTVRVQVPPAIRREIRRGGTDDRMNAEAE